MSIDSRPTQEEMMNTVRAMLEAAQQGKLNPDTVERKICERVGEWVLKDYQPPLISMLYLLREYGYAW